jgi:hypothetical protein
MEINGMPAHALLVHGAVVFGPVAGLLASTIAAMETFQRIYRPEIYNAHSAAGERYQPDLKNRDHSPTDVVYDRDERSQLAVEQGKYAEERLIKPYRALLEQWSANYLPDYAL